MKNITNNCFNKNDKKYCSITLLKILKIFKLKQIVFQCFLEMFLL